MESYMGQGSWLEANPLTDEYYATDSLQTLHADPDASWNLHRRMLSIMVLETLLYYNNIIIIL